MKEKAFKGVIVSWVLEADHIIGMTPARVSLDWTQIRTSRVERITRDHRGYLWAETQNSLYILL